VPDRTSISLEVCNLTIRAGERCLVHDVSFSVQGGEIVALVGASGSGKSMTAKACLGLVRPNPGVVDGQIIVRTENERHAPYEQPPGKKRIETLNRFRGRLVGLLSQDARGALDPLWSVGRQVTEVLQLSQPQLEVTPRHIYDELTRAGFGQPERVATLYPHELSGGMAQRACIALALARGSRFIIADEPTTGLDPTVQYAILQQLRQVAESGIGVLLITHDLRILPDLAHRVMVMHNSRVVETIQGTALADAQSEPAKRLFEATSKIAGRRL